MAMDERKSKDMKKGERCLCGCDGSGMGCACGWHHGHTLFRLLIGVILLILVFWFGVKLGELRESIRGYRGYNGTNYGSYGYRPMPMMNYSSGSGTGTTTAK